MTSAAKLAQTFPVRAMLIGFPGSAKTGSLACLANAGFKLRVLDYDGNLEPLIRYTNPEALENIDIVSLEDKLRGGQRFVETVGMPNAFADGLKMMDRWKYTDSDGEEIDFGVPKKDWGLDTVLVLDSLTTMGKASMRRAMALMNKTPMNTTDGTWGLAMKEQEAFVEKLTSMDNHFHVIVTAHKKLISPKDIRKGDSELTAELKERAADLIPTRYYPSALGQALPPEIGGHFPTILELTSEVKSGKSGKYVRHAINAVPRPELDLKIPVPEIPSGLTVEEDGMLKVFEAITGGLDRCLEAGNASTVATESSEGE